MFEVMHHTPSPHQIKFQDTVTGEQIPTHVHYLYQNEVAPVNIEQQFGSHVGTVELNQHGRIHQVQTNPAFTTIQSELEQLERQPPSSLYKSTNLQDALAQITPDHHEKTLHVDTPMELEAIDDKNISSLMNEFHYNNDKLNSLLSDDELCTLLNERSPRTIESPSYQHRPLVLSETKILKRRSKPQLHIATASQNNSSPLAPLDTPSRKYAFNLCSPYKCNAQPVASPLVSPFKGTMVPYHFTPNSAIQSKERVEKQIQEALASIRGHCQSALSFAADEGNAHEGIIMSDRRQQLPKRRLDFMSDDDQVSHM